MLPSPSPRIARRVAARATALAACLFTTLALTPAARGQDYPNRPIRLVSATQPGSGGDVIARMIAEPLSKLLKQPVVMDNKPGAEGNIAAAAVANARGDGYALLFQYTAHVINPAVHASLPFDPIRDFTPISMLATNWTILVVRANHPAKSVADLIAMMRARPGTLSFGFLPGSVTQVAGEQLFADQNLQVLRVPYKTNAAAVTDMLGGHIDFAFSTLAPVQAQAQAGMLRILASTEPKRSEQLPGIPAMAETIPGFSVTGWYGLMGPKNMAPEVVTLLNRAVRQVLADPELRDKLVKQGSVPSSSTPQEFANFIASEIPRWQGVVRKAGIKPQ